MQKSSFACTFHGIYWSISIHWTAGHYRRRLRYKYKHRIRTFYSVKFFPLKNSFSHIFLGAHNVASFFTQFLAKKEYQYLEQITLFFMWIYVSKAMKHMPLLTKHILQREWIIIFKREWEKLNRIQKGSASSFWVNYHKNFRCKFIETT